MATYHTIKNLFGVLLITVLSLSVSAQTKPEGDPPINPTTGTRLPDTTDYGSYRKNTPRYTVKKGNRTKRSRENRVANSKTTVVKPNE